MLQFCTLPLKAQRFPFYDFKVEQGLIQSQSTCITQDAFGNMWIGTIGGLSRFDGRTFKNYTLSDGLAANIILDVFYSRVHAKLFVSTAKGMQSFDGKSFQLIKDTSGKPIVSVNNIQESEERLLFLSNGSLYGLDKDATKAYIMDSLHTPYTCLYYDGKLLWLANVKGEIYTYTQSALAKEQTNTFNAHWTIPAIVFSVLKDQSGHIWLMTSKGLYESKDNEVRPYMPAQKQLISAPLISAAEDQQHQLWFGTFNGVYKFSNKGLQFYNEQNGLSGNAIYDIKADAEGNMWFGTNGDGVFRYSGGPFISIDNNLGPHGKQVTGISGGPDESLYFVSYQGSLYNYQYGREAVQINTDALKSIPIVGIAYQPNKGLWLENRLGLYLYDHGHFSLISKANRSPISGFYLSPSDTLYIVKDSALLSFYDAHKVDSLPLHVGFDCMIAIGKDSLLLAHSNGFSLYHDRHLVPFPMPDPLSGVTMQAMVYEKGILYCGTNDRGIFQVDLSTQKLNIINTKSGLSSDFVYNLIKDKNGDVWAGTGRGICKITRNAEGQNNIRVYLKEHGVIGLESNSNAAYADKQGHLWFGTTEGLSSLYNDAVPVTPHPTAIVLENVSLFGGRPIDSTYYRQRTGWYQVPEGLSLPYRYNSLSFTFRAITQCPINKILYSYRIDDVKGTWSEWSEENTINISSIEPGDYTLEVRCTINSEVQEQAQLRYRFTIQTPFHKSIWFIVSIFGLSILLGVLLQYYANKRKLKRKRAEEQVRREEQNRVRERTAEDFHDEVGNKLTRINVLTSVLQTKLDASNTDAMRLIHQIRDNTNQLYAGTRDILWSLKPSNDNLFEILNHVTELANEMFSETDIDFAISGNDPSLRQYKMPLDKSRNFIMIWKEALNNCMKYADAKTVRLQINVHHEFLYQIRLVDDGVGFDLHAESSGNGLKNMTARALRLGGRLEVLSVINKGTQVILYIPKIV